MIFTTFRDFSEFFLIFNDFIFYLNRFKINKNKKINILRAGPAWMRRGTQGHVAAPRGPAQRLRGAYIYSFIYIIFNIV